MRTGFFNTEGLTLDAQTERLRFILLLLFVFTLPYDMFYSSVIFLTLCITTLMGFRKEKIRQIPRQFWIFQLIYFLGVMGYVYSLHKSSAGFLLERQLTILIFPIILPLAIKVNEEKVNLLLTSLAITSTCAICYLFVAMHHEIVTNLKMPFIKTAFSGAFFNHQFSRPLNLHAGYLSLYISLSIFYLVFIFNRKAPVYLRLVIILAAGILVAGLFFLASRNSIIATLIVLLFVYPLFRTKNKIRYFIISLSCLALGLLMITQVPYLKQRFSVELITDIKSAQNVQSINYNTIEPRIERWQGAIALIKRSPLIGYGTGDEIELLKTEYIKRGLFISYLENFNAHNQYLSYLLKNGFVGLCIFLLAFCYYLILAIKHKHFMYLAFLILLLIGFYTENILDANKGIFFFALFNTVFGYAILSKDRTDQKLEQEGTPAI